MSLQVCTPPQQGELRPGCPCALSKPQKGSGLPLKGQELQGKTKVESCFSDVTSEKTTDKITLPMVSTSSFSPNSLLLGVLNALKNGRLGAGWSGRVPGRLVSHFLSFVSQFFSFVSQARCLWSGSRSCLPLPFICLPVLFFCLPVLVICLPRLGACGRVPGWLVSHFLSFVSHFFSFVSQGGCLWSGSRLACLPLPFICLPVLFICLPSSVLVVGFPVLSPTSFHLSPSSFLLSPRLGACGRVPGLVSHFLSFVSQFFSFVSQFLSFVSPGWVLVVGFPAGLSPTSFHLSPTSFHLSPRLGACGRVPACLPLPFPLLFICLPVLFIVSQAGCLWSGLRLACLPRRFICLPLLFICLPVLFICLPGWVLVVGFPAGLSPTSFHMSPTSFHFLSPRLGACGRVPGWLVSYFLSFVSHFFSLSPRLGACGRVCGWLVSHVVSFVSHFFSFVSHFFSFVSQFFSLSPRLGACGRVCGWLVSHVVSFVSHFFSFVSHFFSFVSQFFSFVSQAGCLWSGSRLACLPLPFICLPLLFIFCLPGWVLVVGFPAGLSRTFLSFVSFPFICLSPRLGACGRVPACLPLPFPLLFICLPVLFIVSQAGCLWSRVCGWLVSHVVSFVIFVSHFFSLSIHLSSRSVAGGVRPFPMSMQHVYSFVSQL